MKTETHNFFNIGVLTYVGAFFVIPSYSLISAILITSPANRIIDKYGHENKEVEIERRFGAFRIKKKIVIPVRTNKIHSPLSALFWGFIPASIIFIIIYFLRNYYSFTSFPLIPYFILIQGLLSGELHLLLDLPTEGGIFINKKRFSMGHFAYDNLLLNFSGVIMGLFLIYISFGGTYEKIYYTFKYIIFVFKHIV